MAKFTVLLFLFGVSSLLQENFAANVRNADVDNLAAGVQQAITRFFSNFEPAGLNHSNANQWMYVGLNQAEDESAEHEMVAKMAVLNDLTLTTELISLADGFHLVIPNADDRQVENEQRIQAVAIVDLLMNLKTMERMDTILANCSLSSTMHLVSLTMDKGEKLPENGQEYIGRLFVDWLRSITVVLENDPHLSEEFTTSKVATMRTMMDTGYANDVLPPTLETESLQNENVSAVEMKLAQKMFNSHLFRRMSLNRQFLRASLKQMSSHKTAERRRQFLLARALLDLAGQRGEDKRVNEIYQRTLSQATESVSEAKMKSVDEVRDKFFEALEKEFDADRDLAKRLRSIESKMDIWFTFRALRRSSAFL